MKWKSVECYQGDCTFTFFTPEEGTMSFQSIKIDRFDNPYFKEMDKDAMFPEYEIKDSVKEKYFIISYIKNHRQMELSDDKKEVLVIVKISEI